MGFKTGMVGTRQQHCAITLQPVVANRYIFDSKGQGVTNVQVAVGVWGRDGDGKGVALPCWLKGTTLFPQGVNVGFVLPWLIDLR